MGFNKKNRRQFLKNSSILALTLGIVPSVSECKSSKSKIKDDSLLLCDKTTLDYYGEGPFYTENPPLLQDNQLSSITEPGTPITISGRIFNLDCSEFIPNTIIDIWHANDAGDYDNSGGYNLRGKVVSNSQGFYMFNTIKPGKYLNGSSYRPAHIHFKITPPEHDELITQLYFEGDTDIPGDAAASITSGNFDASNRIIPLMENSEGKMEGTWDIVINGSGVTTGLESLHLDKGIIYKTSPNPFSDRLVIQYGVFKAAKVSLLVFDIQGRQVATLEERQLSAEKYEAIWEPEMQLPNGHYFIALKINDLQVHYLKVLRRK